MVGLEEILAVVLAGGSGWLLMGPGVARCRLAHIRAGHRGGPRPAEIARQLVRRLRIAGIRERQRRTATIEVCEGLAAELHAGRSPSEALRRAIEVLEPGLVDELEPTLVAARTGEDVPGALWHAGARPGAAGLRRLAVCFRIGAGSGGAFAPAVERLGAALRDEEGARQEVNAQLAGARATARLLAALPFVGMLLGLGLGVDPFAFWFASPLGAGCLALGVLLDVLGLLWMRRLARRAELAW